MNRYQVILCDPPWRFATWSDKGRGRSPDGQKSGLVRHYETMTTDEIASMPIGDLAANRCALFLWGIDSMVPDVFMPLRRLSGSRRARMAHTRSEPDTTLGPTLRIVGFSDGNHRSVRVDLCLNSS